MKRQLLFKIVGIAFYLITLWPFSDASGEANVKRQRLIERAQKFSFRSQEWKVEEADYFILFFHQSGRSLKRKLEKDLESFSLQVARRIGYKDFQLYQGGNDDWNKKFKFFIYGTQGSWRQAKKEFGAPKWAGAFAGGNRRIFSYHLNLDAKTLLHEMAHEIYREYIKRRRVPAWWNEGIAIFSESPKLDIRRRIMDARFRVVNNTHTPLPQLTSYDMREPRLIYDQGLSVIVFLLSEYGTSSFDTFNKAMRNGKRFEAALAVAYGDYFTTIDGLNQTWEKALRDGKTWRSILKNLSKIQGE